MTLGSCFFGYDAAGLRTYRQETGVGRIYYFRGPSGEVLAEIDQATNSPLRYFVYFDGALAAVRELTGGTPTTEWHHADHLGSTHIVTDVAGPISGGDSVLATPFGMPIPTAAGCEEARFAGHETEEEFGLNYMRARWQAPLLGGAFLSPDPDRSTGRPGKPESWNRFPYVSNRPVNAVDPSGERKFEVVVSTAIPADNVTVLPATGIGGPLGTPAITLAGDGAPASGQAGASFRTRQTVSFDTARSDSMSAFSQTMHTHLRVGGLPVYSPLATGATLRATGEQTGSDAYRVHLSGNESLPIAGGHLAPGITYDVILEIDGAGNAVLHIRHDGFPSYDVTIITEDGVATSVYQHNPQWTGETPLSLFGGGEHSRRLPFVLPPPKVDEE